MKRIIFSFALLASVMLFTLNSCAQAQANKTPNILILATGGTIAGAAESENATVGYQAGVFKIEDLINAVPGMSKIAKVTGEQIANIDSQDMNADIWVQLANRVNSALASSSIDGVVITHGTDTMEETAYFLNLTVKSNKPVVLVGSMRPATAISADGPLNLYNAVKIAGSPSSKGKGVLVTLNDTIHSARDVTKSNSFKVDTFVSPDSGPLGYIQSGVITYYRSPVRKHTTDSVFSAPKDASLMPKVAILYNYAGMTRDYVDSMVDLGVKGIVVAGLGDGGLGTALKESLAEASQKGVMVVRSTRVGSGIVARNADADDDGSGFAVSDNLNAQKARVLLQLALLQTKDPKKIQSMYYQY